jgi:hypothetical protein
MPPAACLDECTDLHLVDALRARGFDVVSLQLLAPRGLSDDAVLQRATELGRVLISHNTEDFRRLDAEFSRQGRSHGGIVCLPQLRGAPFRRLELRASMMLDWLGTQPYTSQLFTWGQLQRLFEGGFRLPGYAEEDVRDALGWSPLR